jgi:hypothetical protein
VEVAVVAGLVNPLQAPLVLAGEVLGVLPTLLMQSHTLGAALVLDDTQTVQPLQMVAAALLFFDFRVHWDLALAVACLTQTALQAQIGFCLLHLVLALSHSTDTKKHGTLRIA